MCSIAKIDAFLEKWPDAEYGPAHIVLSDANLEDHHIDWCIGLCRQWLALEPKSESEREHEMWQAVNQWAEHPREEIQATHDFLVAMRAVPEDDRVEEGDQICG